MNNEELLNAFQKSIADCIAAMSAMDSIVNKLREAPAGEQAHDIAKHIAPLEARIAALEAAMPEVSYERLADNIDYERLADLMDAETIGGYIDAEVDAEDVATYIDVAEVADNISIEQLSAHLDIESAVRDALRNL